MSWHWRPVGPEAEQTYWQRRAVLAGAVVVALIVLVALLTRGGGPDAVTAGSDGTGASPTPTPTMPVLLGPTVDASSPEPSTTGLPATGLPTPSASGAAVACAASALKLEATAEKASYPVGGRPRLSLRITNTGARACTRDLGQAAVELTVVSGSDRIWSSDDCAPGGPADPTTLAPGTPKVISLTWAGKRSRPKCAGDQAQARAGTYRVNGRAGDLTVEGSSFVLTG